MHIGPRSRRLLLHRPLAHRPLLHRPLRVALVTGAALALAPAAASNAAVRHASATDGFGFTCSEQQPCTLAQAVGGAAAGDQIEVHAGSYEATGIGLTTKPLHLRGAPGEARPTIVSPQPPGLGECGLMLGGGSIRDLNLKNEGIARGVCSYGDTTVERVGMWSNGQHQTSLWIGDAGAATLRNVSVSAPGGSGTGIDLNEVKTASVVHVTASAGFAALSLSSPVDDGTTTIRSSSLNGDKDLTMTCASGQDHAVTIDHSSFETVEDGDCTVLDGGGNIGTAGATWAGFTAGVLRPQTDSSLIDAGATGESAEGVDIDGDPRSLGGRPDIGADELYQAPGVSPASSRDVTASSAVVRAYTRDRGAELTAWVEYGTDGAFDAGKEFATINDESTLLGRLASAQLTGLAPSTTYQARLAAMNPAGQVTRSEPVTFTTAAAPAPTPSPSPSAPQDPSPSPTPASPSPSPSPSPQSSPTPAADRTAPRCTVKLARTASRNRVRLTATCDERGKLSLRIARTGRGKKPLNRTIAVKKGKVVRTLAVRGLRSVRFVARDAAGNAAKARTLRLKHLPARKGR